ncbi:MAG: hypothetical protein K0Q95_2378 [Bacteroidota bacterium]|jgi:hypothetical protein|nr:hypothetical protein [Bacteroidota bacterium]
MKKQVLLGVALGVGTFAFAQRTYTGVTAQKVKAAAANRAELYIKNQQAGAEASSFSGLASNSNNAPQNRAYTTTTIGTTGYQLQTNASICNRLINSPDGTLSATWTFSTQASSWSDRGTGYNYFNGTSWGPNPTTRIENTRTGFTNIGITSGGAEVVVSHEASDLHISKRATKGMGAWSNAAFLGSPDVWSRLAVGGANGTTLHVISQTTGTANPPFQGQDGALAYSRSLDGGTTWDKLHTVIPQIDVNSYLGFGGDSYSIDANGDVIAIVAGGFDVDVVLIKSTDNGETWTKTIVNYFPIPLFDYTATTSDIDNDGNPDTLETNDASVHVMLDNLNRAHVWFGRMRIFHDDVTATGVSYFPGTDGLMYWNESMGASNATTSTPVMIAAAEDIDMDGILNVTDWGTYQTSLTSMPSSGIDANGNLYLSYSSIYEGNAENGAPGDGKSYRHTYVMRSNDGGMNWCPPQDITDPGGVIDLTEGVYPAMAKRVDANVHVIVQVDGSVGHGVSANSTDLQSGDANIDYVKIPTADLTCAVGVAENTSLLSSFEVYPNPATENINLAFSVKNNGNVIIRVYNVTGQMVAELANQDLTAGKHSMNVNTTKFNSGIYMINMISAEGTASQKVMIK